MNNWKVFLTLGCIVLILSPFAVVGVIVYNKDSSPATVGLFGLGVALLLIGAVAMSFLERSAGREKD
jgi:hypothetical protein